MYTLHYEFMDKLANGPSLSIVLLDTDSEEEVYSAIFDFGYVMPYNVITLKRNGKDILTAFGDDEQIIVFKWWVFPRQDRKEICKMFLSPSNVKKMSASFNLFEDYIVFVRNYFNSRKLR